MKTYVATLTLNPALDKTVVIPNFNVGGLNRVEDIRIDPGGKGINVARVLKKFAVNVLATGLIAGFQGHQLLKKLEKEDINNSFLEIEGETRTNIKIVDKKSKITTEINECGFMVAGQDLDFFAKKLHDLLSDISILMIGGSLPLGVPPNIYHNYIQLANNMGVRTILDADGIALEEGIKARPFAIKPNLYELEKLLGRRLETDTEIIKAGKELVAQGISVVLVSMGREGSIILDKNEAFRVYPFPITPKSTVGAGDSMVAALVYSLLQNKSLREIARWTTAAGTVTASKEGTQVCTLSEVSDCLDKVEVKELIL